MQSQNRRKCRALNRRSAHNSGSVVRVGALGNKAAHYGSDLVRTGQIAVRRLTSIRGATTGPICRVRRRSAIAATRAVRQLPLGCALSEIPIGRSAQQMRTTAHVNAPRCRRRAAERPTARFSSIFPQSAFAAGSLPFPPAAGEVKLNR